MSVTLISTQTLSGSAASITFSSIPGTYTDLLLVLSLRDTRAIIAGGYDFLINGSTANFSFRFLEGNGASAVSGNGSGAFPGNSVGANATANTFCNTQIYIPNYTAATAKSISVDAVTETNGTTAYTDLLANLWNSTATITSVGINLGSGSFVAGSSISLYGITKGSSGGVTVS